MQTVSIVIPTFQRASVVCEAIRSALNQTYKDYEIIIVDDGSTDDTPNLIKKYEDRIRYYWQPNKGVSAARNFGVENSKGEFIAFLDSDDIWTPEKLSIQMPFFNSPSVGLVFGNMRYFKENVVQKKTSFDLYPPVKGKIFNNLFTKNFIPTSTVVIRRKCLEEIGQFDKNFEPCEDYDMWMRILRHWEADYCPQPVAFYRISSNQASKKPIKAWTSLVKVQESLVQQVQLSGDNLSNEHLYTGLYKRYLRLATYALLNEDKGSALQWLNSFSQKFDRTIFWYLLFGLYHLPLSISRPLIRLGHLIINRQEYGQY